MMQLWKLPVLWTQLQSLWWRLPMISDSLVVDLAVGWESFLCLKMNQEVVSCPAKSTQHNAKPSPWSVRRWSFAAFYEIESCLCLLLVVMKAVCQRPSNCRCLWDFSIVMLLSSMYNQMSIDHICWAFCWVWGYFLDIFRKCRPRHHISSRSQYWTLLGLIATMTWYWWLELQSWLRHGMWTKEMSRIHSSDIAAGLSFKSHYRDSVW